MLEKGELWVDSAGYTVFFGKAVMVGLRSQ